ncbi:hypothetical protein ABK040_014035 [Willaertia magna]
MEGLFVLIASKLNKSEKVKFPLEEIKTKKKIPSFLRKQSGNNEDIQIRYKVNLRSVEEYFKLTDCIIEEEGKQGCLVMDGFVNPEKCYIASGVSLLSNNLLNTFTRKTGLVYDERMQNHVGRGSHPESPARISGIWNRIQEQGLENFCIRLEARMSTKEELELTHSSEHVTSIIESDIKKLKYTSDVFMSEGSGQAARIASGSLIDLSKQVVTGQLNNGFAIIRPPGHHCYYDKASGFCLLNNIMIAANVLRCENLAKRIMIVDYDVHHGNGTQSIIEEQFRAKFSKEGTKQKIPEIIFVSIHQTMDEFYPSTGTLENLSYPEAKQFIVNIPFNSIYGDEDVIEVFNQIILPLASSYQPEIVLVSAGFDAVKGDKLGGQQCTPELFGYLTHLLSTVSENGRVVCALEGGYQVEETSECVANCLKVLLGNAPKQFCHNTCSIYTTNTIQKIKNFYEKEWGCLQQDKKSG